MATGYKVGRHVRVYVDETGAGQGTYTELDVNRAPSYSTEWSEGTVQDHAEDFDRALKGTCAVTFDIEMNMKTGDAQYEAMRTAHQSPDDGVIGLAITTGDLTTGDGEHMFEMDAEIMGWSESNSIGDTVTVTATCKPAANTDFSPTWSTITVV